MMRAQAWNVSGVGRATRDIAEEAARRAGMTLGEWLDQVVADRAADQGLDPRDLNDNDRLDAISDRLGQLSRDDRGSYADPYYARARSERRPAARNAMRDSEGAPSKAQQDGDRRTDALLDAAIERLESRLARAEERSARAFDTVTQFIKRSEADRRDERETLRAVADRLNSIDQRASAPVSAAAEPLAREKAGPSQAPRDLDERIGDLSRRVESADRARREPQNPAEAPRGDFKDAIARIARRRQELDARDARTPRLLRPRRKPRPRPRRPKPAAGATSASTGLRPPRRRRRRPPPPLRQPSRRPRVRPPQRRRASSRCALRSPRWRACSTI